MKKTYYFMLVALFCSFTGITSCVSNDHEILPNANPDGSHAIELNYQVSVPVDIQTYATAGVSPTQTKNECKITSILTLFFDDTGKYLGYTDTGTATPDPATVNTGTIRTTLPSGDGGPISNEDELKLIVLANYHEKVNLEGEANIKDFLNNKIKERNYDEVLESLRLFYKQDTGIHSPLPMSSSVTKAAGSKKAEIQFRRRVARIDVENKTSEFVLKSVRLYNANNNAYAFDKGGLYLNTPDQYTSYTQNIIELAPNSGDQKVEAKLYAFPNYNEQPLNNDHQTTCLIVGGTYNGDPAYYRINVTFSTGAQKLKSNGLYKIKITNVKGPGEEDPEDAYDNGQAQLDYEINEWENGVDDGYSVDKDGNALGVSSSSVVFSSKGGQEIPLEVFLVQSTTNPLNLNDWNVDPIITGTDADKFKIEKDASNPIPTVIVSTTGDNRTIEDYVATAFVTWGSIKAPISLKQLSVTSSFNGIKVYPEERWFSSEGGTKEVTLNLLGNFKGVTKSDIKVSIISEDGEPTEWISVNDGTSEDDISGGIFHYNLTATVEEENLDRVIREARVKFIVSKGDNMASAEVAVKQTSLQVDDTPKRDVELRLYILNDITGEYEGIATASIDGYPDPLIGEEDIQRMFFPIMPANAAYYEIVMKTDQEWKINLNDDIRRYLTFSQTDGSGDMQGEPIKVTVNADAIGPWTQFFTIEYQDETKTPIRVFQRGVYAKATGYPALFYEAVYIGGQWWTDRPLGNRLPTSHKDYKESSLWIGEPLNKLVSDFEQLSINNLDTYDKYNGYGRLANQNNLAINEFAQIKCPSGWRFPNMSEAIGFINLIRADYRINTTNNEPPYITYGTPPNIHKQYINLTGRTWGGTGEVGTIATDGIISNANLMLYFGSDLNNLKAVDSPNLNVATFRVNMNDNKTYTSRYVINPNKQLEERTTEDDDPKVGNMYPTAWNPYWDRVVSKYVGTVWQRAKLNIWLEAVKLPPLTFRCVYDPDYTAVAD